MKNLLVLLVFSMSLFADFNNKLYSDVCYTIANNRVDLQPKGAKAAQIRAEIVNRAYVTSKVVVWEREDKYEFPGLILIEDDVMKNACSDALKLEKTSPKDTFVFYLAYQKAVYNHTVDALMKLAKVKNQK